jgi:hypothetical protein
MFEAFERSFAPDPDRMQETDGALSNLTIPGLNELFVRFGGASFNNGLYRIIRASDVREWNARISLAFPNFAKQTTCFGYDWLGRVFAADLERLERGQPGVLMLEPGTGKALRVPANVEAFHDDELIQDADSALAINFHKEWLAGGRAAPAYPECIGYKVPLFLGGADEIGNLELSDLDVYWNLMGQLIEKTRDLPAGTRIARITID